MSLLRTALALSLLLGTSAQEPHKLHRAKRHLRHHKHHSDHKHHSAGLWSHGQKFELVLPDAPSEATPESQDAGLVKLARATRQSENPSMAGRFVAGVAEPSQPAKETQTAPDNADQQVDDQQPVAQDVVDPKPRVQETEKQEDEVTPKHKVVKASNYFSETLKAATDQVSQHEYGTVPETQEDEVTPQQKVVKASNHFSEALKTFTDQKSQHEDRTVPETQEDEVTTKQKVIKANEIFSATLKAATDHKSEHEDYQSHSTKQKSSNAQAQGFSKIRQELRLAKKEDHQVKVLNKHLHAELDMLFKSSELQNSADTDEESDRLLQQQTRQLKTMADQTKTRISESQKVAQNAARLAAQQAEALRDAARAEEKKAEEQLQKSKETVLEADKLDKIALKELRKVESK